MGEAVERETGAYAITGFLVGAIIYVLAVAGLERLAARSPTHRPRPPGRGAGAAAKPETTEVAATTGLTLLVGALIDGIPESAAIGLSLHAEGRSLGIVLLAAVFLANVPESLGGAGRCGRRVAPAATSSASGPGSRSCACLPPLPATEAG
jgi:ZIP family zinc transporter